MPATFYDNPDPVYLRLRDTIPVLHLPDDGPLLSRWADLDASYRDLATFSSDERMDVERKFGCAPLHAHPRTGRLFNDVPLRQQVRVLIEGPLMPRAITGMPTRLC